MDLRKIIEIAAVVLVLLLLGLGWYGLTRTASDAEDQGSAGVPVEIRGRVPIPYFLLVMDRSGSMESENSDPENYEKEALKQAIRLIYWNGKQLHDATGFYPRVRIVGFSGDPVSITGKEGWTKITSEQDIAKIDRYIDDALEKRTGLFTDINAAVQYIIKARDSAPAYLGKGEDARPVSVMTTLFTDGAIDPNYLNPVNHKTNEQWQNFKEKTLNLANEKLGKEKSANLRKDLGKHRWLDPTTWAEANAPGPDASNFRNAYYTLNQNINAQAPNKLNYAKVDVRKKFHGRLQAITEPPPLNFNVIALIKGDERDEEIAYLKKWTRNLGFFYHIQDAGNLGALFVDMMAPYLNSYSEKFLLTDAKTLGPFGEGVASVQIYALFKDRLSKADQDKLIRLISPSGKETTPAFESVFAHSRGYYLSKDRYSDFYGKQGWQLELRSANLNEKSIKGVKCFMVVNQKYMLEIEKAGQCPGNNCTRYIIYLIDPETNRPVPLDKFSTESQPAFKYKVEMMDQSQPYEVRFSPNREKNAVNADFVDWPSGMHNIKIQLVGGGFQKKARFLKGLSITRSIEVGTRVWFNDPSTKKEITGLTFESLDRK